MSGTTRLALVITVLGDGMPEGTSWQKEQLSVAYVHALATQVGYTVAHWNVDKDGVDPARSLKMVVDDQAVGNEQVERVGPDVAQQEVDRGHARQECRQDTGDEQVRVVTGEDGVEPVRCFGGAEARRLDAGHVDVAGQLVGA